MFVHNNFMAKFINPESIVAQMELKRGQTVADFGCGAGFYTVAAAKAVGSEGVVYAVDILPDRLAATQSSAQHAGLKNVSVLLADLEQPVRDIDAVSCDAVVASNILHLTEKQDMVLRNAFYVLKTGGQLLVVEWKKGYSVFGPSQRARLAREDIVKSAQGCGFRLDQEFEADRSHMALLFVK